MAITKTLDLAGPDVADRCATEASLGWAVRTIATYDLPHADRPRALVVLERDAPEAIDPGAGPGPWRASLDDYGRGRTGLDLYHDGERFLRIVGLSEAIDIRGLEELMSAANRPTTTQEATAP